MSDVEAELHECWGSMVKPIDGLVVSVPVRPAYEDAAAAVARHSLQVPYISCLWDAMRKP
jgi:hypothetical protein